MNNDSHTSSIARTGFDYGSRFRPVPVPVLRATDEYDENEMAEKGSVVTAMLSFSAIEHTLEEYLKKSEAGPDPMYLFVLSCIYYTIYTFVTCI